MPAPSKEKAQLHEQGLRRCSRCERVLSEGEFGPNKQDRFGLMVYCRKCHAERASAQYHTHPEKFIDRVTKWRKDHPEWFKQYSTHTKGVRRARKTANGTFEVTPREITSLLSQPCYHCGAPSEHVDHIIPISRGGSHGIGNLGPMCASCNLSKGAKTYAEFRYGR